MLTPEQIEQAAESAGIVETPALFYSQGWRGVAPDDMEAFARAIDAQALKDAAEVCETLYAQTGRTFDHRACAAAILALGKEKP
jgi:hypothetical protein